MSAITLKRKKINQDFIGALVLSLIFGFLGFWLLMKFNSGSITVSDEKVKLFPYVSIVISCLFLLLALKKRKRNSGNFTYNDEGFTNLDTSQNYLWKDLSDLYFVGSSIDSIELYGGIAFRKTQNDSWIAFTQKEFALKQLQDMVSKFNKAKTEEVLRQIEAGKTAVFNYLPNLEDVKNDSLKGLAINLSVKTKPIEISKEELKLKDKKHPIANISEIGKREWSALEGQGYYLKTKQDEKLLHFKRTNLMNYDVFVDVINNLTHSK